MASENETVASVTDCIRHMADNMPNGVILNIAQCNFTADRIETANKREVENVRALAKELADALGSRIECHYECGECTMWPCTNKANRALVAKARKALEGAKDERK